MFKVIRVSFLLLVLFSVALTTYRIDAKHADWRSTKWVVIYPLNGDGSDAVALYIKKLKEYRFEPIAEFMAKQAKIFKLANSEPIKIMLGPAINENPPALPTQPNRFDIAWWSLKVRYWASGIKKKNKGPPADITIFVKYFDPEQYVVLPHSTAIAKLSLGLVNAFAHRREEKPNNVVITHELLHVFNATDKYDLNNNMPIFPSGYAQPDRDPRYPQDIAEIMGGRIPISEFQADIPAGLRQVIIGEQTAQEINWQQANKL